MQTKTVMMPRELTAENGAKASFIGEFRGEVIVPCGRCEGDGWEDEDAGEDCHECGGSGGYGLKVSVSWTTIKEIYAKAVKELGV